MRAERNRGSPGVALALAAVLAGMPAGCRNERDNAAGDGPRRFGEASQSERVPPQYDGASGQDPGLPPPFVEMGDPRSAECIVRDISFGIAGAGWRWTYLDPLLQFWWRDAEGQRFSIDFSIAEAGFRQTGPVTLSCFINGHLLGMRHCPRLGEYHFEAHAPAAWLRERNQRWFAHCWTRSGPRRRTGRASVT